MHPEAISKSENKFNATLLNRMEVELHKEQGGEIFICVLLAKYEGENTPLQQVQHLLEEFMDIVSDEAPTNKTPSNALYSTPN